ncbi:MAG: RNA-binding transcriptional accessory protein [Deltaproteobacteria bacterium HGW-Deltaproteobacteria-22]|nr:MAG: RNA-binding transcriptional accessory protein [Deltaproteobacteria bacterium HGW-Deltaproteobacteria-22]
MSEEKLISIEELSALVPAIAPEQWVAHETGIPLRQVAATMQLLDEGATVPFISRYRKEATGGLDEVGVTSIRDQAQEVREFADRRRSILESVAEQGKLTPVLLGLFLDATRRTEIEDLYLPYKRKRLTRADKARGRGLEPLALVLLGQSPLPASGLEAEAARHVNPEQDVPDAEAALAGARDICAEVVSEHVALREALRDWMRASGRLASTVIRGKETEAAQFRDYHDYSEPLARVPSHRVLAVARGENEQLLRVHVEVEKTEAPARVQRFFPTPEPRLARQWELIREDTWERLLHPGLESELRRELKDRADREAIQIFVGNLRELLMSPPLGAKRVMALDPGFRTGCKVAVLNAQGTFLANKTIYPHPPREEVEFSQKIVLRMIDEYQVESIAVGSGTAGRETESFLRDMVREGMLASTVPIVRVDESGASIYSASPIAREEFPDLDLTVRGAISIGRRMQDPLGELVKIEPKSLGIGQYQHDVDQPRLRRALDDVVESCVNSVGVELNTASHSLLQYVSGLGEKLAKSIVSYRDEHGPFDTRKELLKVPRLGPKAFEQCAGFVRVREGRHPLDASAVHPERYELVERMARDLGVDVKDVIGNADLIASIPLDRYVTDGIGRFTLADIIEELKKPGRDPRRAFEAAGFREDIREFEDLEEGMILTGIVTNVTAFGAFVDIGVHQDGLIHVSELSHTFVKDPMTVVRPGLKVTVKVIGLDVQRRRIALSIKACTEPGPGERPAGARPQGRPEGPREDRGRGPNAKPQPNQRPREDRGGGNPRSQQGPKSQGSDNPFQKFFGDKKGK